jgi:hypothetical protein
MRTSQTHLLGYAALGASRYIQVRLFSFDIRFLEAALALRG